MTQPQQDSEQQQGSGQQQDPADQALPPSGLRSPAAAVRGIGTATLLLETLVLLLALQPMRQLSSAPDWVALAVVGALVLATATTAGTLRHAWGWKLGIGIQLAIMLAGFVHLALLLLGLVFLGIWIYVLRVRRSVLNSD
jgi:chromate transport protein ChrA